jgi:hypothetical protein
MSVTMWLVITQVKGLLRTEYTFRNMEKPPPAWANVVRSIQRTFV